MYRYIKFQSLGILTGLLLLFGCSDDLGNYEYTEINEVQFEGFDQEYTALFGEPFTITPTLQFTKDDSGNESRYTYEWYALANAGLPLDIRKDLATTKNLDLTSITIPPGKYKVIYRVGDQQTDVVWQKSFTLNVKSSIFEGWMVLNDVDGTARLDMISLIDDEYTPIHDVLDFAGSSLVLEGAPVNVLCYSYDPQFYGIYVTTTGNGTTKIHPETFDWESTYRLSYEMLGNIPTDYAADFIEPLSSAISLMYKDGEVYYYFRTFQYRYGNPINSVDGVDFEAAPFIGGIVYGDNILYDNTNKRFVRHSYNAVTCRTMPEGTLFDYTTNKDLVYMTSTAYNGGELFAILKEPLDNKLYLARMTFTRSATTQIYYEEIPPAIAADMDQATHFAVNPDFGYVFYSVGSKVYEYDFSLKTSKLMLDKGTEEISLIKFESNMLSNKLIVCSHGAGSSSGTFELYTVPPVNGDLELDDSYDGFGKVVSVSYRLR